MPCSMRVLYTGGFCSAIDNQYVELIAYKHHMLAITNLGVRLIKAVNVADKSICPPPSADIFL